MVHPEPAQRVELTGTDSISDKAPAVLGSRSCKTSSEGVQIGGGSIRGVEYAVTDASQNVIAIVRPIPPWRTRGMPRWAERKPGWFAVVGPDESGVTVTSGSQERQVLVEGTAPIGAIEHFRFKLHVTFRDCTCGQQRSKCQCAGRQGTLRYWRVPKPHVWSRRYPAWRVIDSAGHEFARVTSQQFVMGLGPEDTRSKLARWAKQAHSMFMIEPKWNCEVIEVGSGFDWHRHGLLVALAASCEPSGGGSAL